MSTLMRLLRMFVPSLTVFFASGCIMVLELVASRLVAKDLGSSLYTWTSIIGVVLSGIAVGSYAGGRIADRYDARRALAVFFGLSSAACVATIIVNNSVGHWAWLWHFAWPAHVFVHVSLVFFLPSVLLGTIHPLVTKMALDLGLSAGRTIGTLHAWQAAGSIAGTLLAGFYLIAHHGTIMIIWSVGAAMLVMALFYWISCWVLYFWAIVFGALATMGMAPADWATRAGLSVRLRQTTDPNVVLYENETPYCHVQVRRVSERPDRRALWQDQTRRAEIVVDDVTSLQAFDTKIYAGLTHSLIADKQSPSMLIIGGGGYVLPQYLKATWPHGLVEVAEVDPGLTEAAAQAFGMQRDTPIKTIDVDARRYVEHLVRTECAGGRAQRYDFIYTDAISDCHAPFELLTQQFNEAVARLLAADGLYMLGLIDTHQSGRFLGAVVNTLEQTFPHVYVVANRLRRASQRDRFIVVAGRGGVHPEALLERYDEHLPFRLLDESEVTSLKEKADHLVLTDDYAPVENLLTAAVRQGATERLAYRHLRDAITRQQKGQYERSIARYRRAMELSPSLSIRAYNAIGDIRRTQGDLAGAADAFRSAIQFQADFGIELTAVASVHMNLGMLLRRMDKPAEANEHFALAVKWFRIDLRQNPNSVVVWDWLGDTLAIMTDFKGASDAFEKAVDLDPTNPAHYRKLARALEVQRRYSEAIAVVRRQIEVLKEQGERDLAMQMSQYVEILEYEQVKRRQPPPVTPPPATAPPPSGTSAP